MEEEATKPQPARSGVYGRRGGSGSPGRAAGGGRCEWTGEDRCGASMSCVLSGARSRRFPCGKDGRDGA